jgi:Tfp pilus assembly protein PilN
LSILQTTHIRLKKTLIKITLFSPFVVKTPKREKNSEAKMWCQLLVILRLLIVVDLLLIIVIIKNTSRVNVEGNQLSRSQRGVGIRDRWEGRFVGKL